MPCDHMPPHDRHPVAIIVKSNFFCLVLLLGTVLIDFQVLASIQYSNSNDSMYTANTTNIFDAKNISNVTDFVNTRNVYNATNVSSPSSAEPEDISRSTSSSLTSSVQASQTSHQSMPRNKTDHWERTYDVASWLPKKKKKQSLHGGKVNLAIIPVLALLFFITVVCLKLCSFFRKSHREKESETGFMENYFILNHGDEEYMDVDLRSDSSVLYDTVSSYTSFLRGGSNYNTWNSVRSVQVVLPTDMQALYKAFLLQRKESINSSKGLMKKPVVLRDVEVQVELMSRDVRKSKPNDKVWHTEEKNTKNKSKLPTLKVMGSECSDLGNGFVSQSSSNVLKNNHSGDAAGKESLKVSNITENKSISVGTNSTDDGSPSKFQKKPHRFKVSFVTDDSGNVVSSSQPSSISPSIDSQNHSPSSILSNSTLWSKTSEN
ncbi:uncharacterized protein LOC121367985 [Gigantopelta aegis]|uniref:uncharacterized protein LOC121367985 n=1 Tax=Gigantopelta aegis TaxID=1735272 RepID=UPI001B887B68|nr:uncharacterized protein LOC121367985 [Gigantopelta aegis]